MGFFDFLTEEIAIDLGTANTLIIHNDKVVIDSPSIVARDRASRIHKQTIHFAFLILIEFKFELENGLQTTN